MGLVKKSSLILNMFALKLAATFVSAYIFSVIIMKMSPTTQIHEVKRNTSQVVVAKDSRATSFSSSRISKAGDIQSIMSAFQHNTHFKLRSMRAKNKTIFAKHPELEELVMERCERKKYNSSSYPTVSVVISFGELESLKSIVHTVTSVVYTTPANVLKEVILISDNSRNVQHGEKLVNFTKAHFPGLVKVFRTTKSLGMSGTQVRGFRRALGEVVVMMEPSTEVQPRWLEPLLVEITSKNGTVASSMLDWLAFNNTGGYWRYTRGSSRIKTVFDWTLRHQYQEVPHPFLTGQIDATEAIRSPMMSGVVWAVRKKDLLQFGELNSFLIPQAGGNLDLVYRTVGFGGRHVNVPCSHVALVEKSHRDEPNLYDIRASLRRLIDLWFTNFTDIIFMHHPELQREFTQLTSVERHRQRQMKYNFDHFWSNFFPELAVVGRGGMGWGHLRNVGLELTRLSSQCLTAALDRNIILEPCEDAPADRKLFLWNDEGELRGTVINILVSRSDQVVACGKTELQGLQKQPRWIHWEKGPLIPYGTWKTECLEVNQRTKRVFMADCNYTEPYQQWTFDQYSSVYRDIEAADYKPPADISSERKRYLNNFNYLRRPHVVRYVKTRH